MEEYALQMTAAIDIQVDIDTARQWFLGLKEHPERYTFATHLGFYFTKGDFGEVGSQFYTKERFQGIPAKLSFTLSEMTDNSFSFELTKPLRHIKGTYTLTPQNDEVTTVSLSIYTLSKNIQRLFRIKPFYKAIERQINGEVGHIKASMEKGE